MRLGGLGLWLAVFLVREDRDSTQAVPFQPQTLRALRLHVAVSGSAREERSVSVNGLRDGEERESPFSVEE